MTPCYYCERDRKTACKVCIHGEADEEELTLLLATAGAAQAAIPELRQITEVDHSSDMVVTLAFTSCRAASSFFNQVKTLRWPDATPTSAEGAAERKQLTDEVINDVIFYHAVNWQISGQANIRGFARAIEREVLGIGDKGGTDYSDHHGPDWTDRDGEYLK